MKLYIAITADEYELPIAVGTSWTDLARLLKVNPSAIYKKRRTQKTRKTRGYKVIEIEADNDFNDD